MSKRANKKHMVDSRWGLFLFSIDVETKDVSVLKSNPCMLMKHEHTHQLLQNNSVTDKYFKLCNITKHIQGKLHQTGLNSFSDEVN